jgi:hypothetical protein
MPLTGYCRLKQYSSPDGRLLRRPSFIRRKGGGGGQRIQKEDKHSFHPSTPFTFFFFFEPLDSDMENVLMKSEAPF